MTCSLPGLNNADPLHVCFTSHKWFTFIKSSCKSIMCAIGSIQNGLKVLFSYTHDTQMVQNLEGSVNTCLIYSNGTLSGSWFSQLPISFAIYGCSMWTIDPEIIFMTRRTIISYIIKSEVSAFPVFVIFSGCMAVGYIIIFRQLFYMDPGKSGFLFSLLLPMQSMMCVNNWAYCDLKVVNVCVYITLYHHHYADIPENIENIKWLSS